MDEGLLNDLLECSVCLERLDTSSRVLPCQHTFCLKCLKEIVQSHKELRCPECRVLVEAKVEELPPNVLLMRILEGMRNAAPRKNQPASGNALRASRISQMHQQMQCGGSAGGGVVREGQPYGNHINAQQIRQNVADQSGGKQVPHARAVYDYLPKEPGDLPFKKGDVIYLLKKIDPFWYQGESGGKTGVFPITYAQIIVQLPAATPLCKALYDFRMSAPDEEGCLAFDKGAVMTVIRRVDENWAEGKLEDRIGIFPIAFVDMNHAARDLMKVASNPAGLRRAPPIPGNDGTHRSSPRAGNSEQRAVVAQHHNQQLPPGYRYQPMSLSSPVPNVQANYHNLQNMSQSHPNFHPQHPTSHGQILVPQSVSHPVHTITSSGDGGALVATSTVHRNIMEPTQNKPMVDLIQFANMHNKVVAANHPTTMGVQSLNMRIGEGYDTRHRALNSKYSLAFNTTPVHNKNDQNQTNYQNLRTQESFPVSVANFNAANNLSSDSSSSVTTPSVGVSSVTTTPNTSSNTSGSENEPSTPSSPENNVIETNGIESRINSHDNSILGESMEHAANVSDEIVRSGETSSIQTGNASLNTTLSVEANLTGSPKSLNVSMASSSSSSSHNTSNRSGSPKLDGLAQTEASTSMVTILENNEGAKDASRLNHHLNTSVGNQGDNQKVMRTANADLAFVQGQQMNIVSPSHSKEGGAVRNSHGHHHREKDKRHSLTPGSASHLQVQTSHTPSQNRHSAEILATSLLDHPPPETNHPRPADRDKERRRRRSRSNDRALPAAYVALYPYKPQKADELELKKGAIYMVMERCQDGWYKGCSNRTQKCGVFPGNYVAPARLTQVLAGTNLPGQVHRSKHAHGQGHKEQQNANVSEKPSSSSSTKNNTTVSANVCGVPAPPDLPPRSHSPTPVNSGPTHSFPWSSPSSASKSAEKSRDKPSKQEKSGAVSTGVSLMKRLAAMKKCKSPPPLGYSMDNPVFEDCSGPVGGNGGPVSSHGGHHPVHVRSGSCPSQLLQVMPGLESSLLGGTGSVSSAVTQRLLAGAASSSHRISSKHGKERPSVLAVLGAGSAGGSSKVHGGGGVRPGPDGSGTWQQQPQPSAHGHPSSQHQHRKSASLDAGSVLGTTTRSRQQGGGTIQTCRERFRCIVPYPPNSEYELELKVDDVVIVHKKRGDGWYKGTLERTGKTGLFPASFVEAAPIK